MIPDNTCLRKNRNLCTENVRTGHRDYSDHQQILINSAVYAEPSLNRAVEFLAAERSLIVTNVYHHFALLHIVASKLEITKGVGKLRGGGGGLQSGLTIVHKEWLPIA